jgi:hypothetical protein
VLTAVVILFTFSAHSTTSSSSSHFLSSFDSIIIMTTTCEVVLVGCGAPGRGMGWYHAEQLLKGKCPSAVLKYIVEPWFLGSGALL